MAIRKRPGIEGIILATIFIFEEQMTNSFFGLLCISHEIYAFVLRCFSLIKAMLIMKVMNNICPILFLFQSFSHLTTNYF